eukprot:COSAG01_NODE_3248_length_6356_cov_12.014224_5_plen_74_part_00
MMTRGRYEPVDMLRKLALSGLLQFLKPGTGAQVSGGCVIAFASFGLQLYHLGVTSFPGILPWLRFAHVFENWW